MSGTNRLMANLSRHDNVWTPPILKEAHYFDVVHLGTKARAILKSYQREGAKIVERRPKFKPYFKRVTESNIEFTDEWYAKLFSRRKAGALAGECTSIYCALPDKGVAHVKSLCPNVRLIYIIRDPFSRMITSLEMKMKKLAVEHSSHIEAFLDDPTFLAYGDYRANISRWESHFDPAAILYIPYGKLMTDPLSVLRDVEQHLGLDAQENYPKLSGYPNQTKKDDKVIEDSMIARVKELVAPQDTFLAEKFGKEFMEAIR